MCYWGTTILIRVSFSLSFLDFTDCWLSPFYFQQQLWNFAQRTTALPFGRGAFTLATTYTLLTEVWVHTKMSWMTDVGFCTSGTFISYLSQKYFLLLQVLVFPKLVLAGRLPAQQNATVIIFLLKLQCHFFSCLFCNVQDIIVQFLENSTVGPCYKWILVLVLLIRQYLNDPSSATSSFMISICRLKIRNSRCQGWLDVCWK